MPVDRRQLLGLGAALAAATVIPSCGGESSPRSDRTRAPVPSTTPSTVPSAGTPGPARTGSPGPAFAGRPPAGQLYYGASILAGRSLPLWEQRLGSTLSVRRSYFTPDPNENDQLVRRCRDDLARGRLPHVSSKLPTTWADVAAGEDGGWLRRLIGGLAQVSGPIFFTLHHEPENDAGPPGMKAADFVAMQRRAIRVAADLAPNVTVVPVIQHWTFEPLNPRGDPPAWIVPEASVLGFDVYNAWSPTNGNPWRSFGERADDVLGWFGDTPVAIGEYGCQEDPDDPGRAAEWLRDAADYARSHNIVSMSYFNSGVNSPQGSVELRGGAEETFAELLASDWVARPG